MAWHGVAWRGMAWRRRCRGRGKSTEVVWHGGVVARRMYHGMAALATSSTRCRGRAVVQRKLEPSRDGPSVRPYDRHAGGAAIKRRHQSSSIIIIMPAAPKACLLQRAACSEPLAASHLR